MDGSVDQLALLSKFICTAFLFNYSSKSDFSAIVFLSQSSIDYLHMHTQFCILFISKRTKVCMRVEDQLVKKYPLKSKKSYTLLIFIYK